VQQFQKGRLLFRDSFSAAINKNWVIEANEKSDPNIHPVGGRLHIEVVNGATVWYNKPLSGNYIIEIHRRVVVENVTDRLSDMNFFWAATDTRDSNLFTRKGVLESYDSLQMYYAGIGGNTNKTTRLRKYTGTGERKLLAEYKDAAHLLEANKDYLVQIVVYNGLTQLYSNGILFFSYRDEQPLKQGFFGIRTTKSHQLVDDVAIYEITGCKNCF